MGRKQQTTGMRLRFHREARRLTLKELGVLAGVSGEAIRLIELGRRDGRPTTWRRLAEALGVPEQILLR